jgi:uncharacterized membrane protein YgdD (TMEM256/DUF423 family)
MIRIWVAAAAIGGFFSVAAGALAAHLAAGDRAATLLRTGALYGMIHATALIAVTVMAEAGSRLKYPLLAAGWSFAAGMFLFSFSLFGLALTGIEWLGLVTPIGGAGFLVGWAALGLHAFDRAR